MPKLTKAQQDVIDKMKNGWELIVNTICMDGTRCSLHKLGMSQRVRLLTVSILLDRRLIKSDGDEFPIRTYHLTAKAKEQVNATT